ncbi:MAG TPA: MFS transporter [Steroidobacteraceae bacterium]|nr:MFS transporter [Steroidobacteraceae bacterium]
MTNEPPAPPQGRLLRSQWRVLVLSSLGGALEFYDFVVYGTFAQYIGNAFFPATDPVVRLLLAFALFAVGYVARPVGGVVLSHFGDRYGRRRVFIASILMMSSATVTIGLLPTYARWGVAAPVAMVLLRLLQGFSLGGELPGAITYVVETAPRQAGFASGFIFFCVNTGVALASALFWAVQLLPPQAGAQWGWRIAFLFGGVAGLVSFWLRLSLQETSEFRKMHQAAVAERPFLELMRTRPGAVLVGIAALTATAGFNGLLFAMPAFLPTVMHYGKAAVGAAQNIGLLVLSFGLLSTAWLGDRIPRHWILRVGSLLLAAGCFPFFNAAAEHSVGLIPLFIGAGLAASFVNGPMCGIVGDLFPTRIRFSGVAVSFNLAFSIFSGTAPVLATLLARDISPASAAYIMLICGLVTFAGTLFVKRYDGHILGDPRPDAAAVARAPSFPAQ